MPNNRIYYAIQQVKLGTVAATETNMAAIRGLQSVGITTNFNLEQVFELGQLAIYQNIENVPDVEITLNKVLDGYPLIYTLATEKGSSVGANLVATDASLPGRQNARCDVRLGIFPDTQLSASGTSPTSVVTCSGMYVSSVSYSFPIDGNFTEDVTLVGNNKVWSTSTSGATSGVFTNDDSPASPVGVARRQYLDMSSCRFPSQIPGVNSTGLVVQQGNGQGYSTHFQNITVNCDFGREAINELGTFAPYFRYVTFPVEVTSEFEVLAISGDMINATESGYYSGLTGNTVAGNTSACTARHNLLDQVVFLQTCEGTRISLGNKNKLTSVNYNGGDTGGGNVTVTYSYTTYNDFVVAHSGGLYYDSVTAPSYS